MRFLCELNSCLFDVKWLINDAVKFKINDILKDNYYKEIEIYNIKRILTLI